MLSLCLLMSSSHTRTLSTRYFMDLKDWVLHGEHENQVRITCYGN